MQATLIVDGKHELGECAIWCERSQSVYWTDIQASHLWNYRPVDGAIRRWSMPERLSVFALTAQPQRLLIGLASRLAFLDLATEIITPICEVETDLSTTRLNDGRCDRQGRFVFGTLNEDSGRAPIGSFYRLDRDLKLERLPLPSIAISNSICFSPDGHRMYFCDTLQGKIMCCDYHADGTISDQRVFVDLSDLEGGPDGSLIDADGYLWNAQWGASRVARYAPDGRFDRSVSLPVSQPSCPAFGGVAFNTLYITTAHEGMRAAQRANEPTAGGLFAITLDDIRGLPESRFAG